MSFPIQIFLYIFYGFLAVWGIFFLIALYHLFRFGFKNLITIFSIFVFVGVAVLMLSTSFRYISKIDWNQEISIFQNMDDAKISF